MISIITPHFNDFEGLKRIYNCLRKQRSDSWEWLVIDDLSDTSTRDLVKDFFQEEADKQVQLIFNSTKTNASVCRNIGIDKASNEHLIFLDSDDIITEDFVANRLFEVEEFVILKNYKIINEKGEVFLKRTEVSNPLDCFLRANFIWQTTCILWNKAFLIQIGKFDPNLERLQDVELSIRALFIGKHYKIIDNQVDFYYYTKPIRLISDIIKRSCTAVNYLILKIYRDYTLDKYQHSLIKAYYYACIKNLHRTTNKEDVVFVKESLKLFHQKTFIGTFRYFIGHTLLYFYRYHMISDSVFLKGNRYFFK